MQRDSSNPQRGVGANCKRALTFEPGIASREGGHVYDDVSGTLRANAGDNQMAVAYVVENHPADSRVKVDESGVVQTLTSWMGTGGGNVPLVMTFAKSRRAKSNTDFETWNESGIANTLNLFDQGDVRATNIVVQPSKPRYIVRRLTPLECERLQGYPDGWTDIGEWTDSNGKKRQTSDAARYKALGNSIALPPWKWVLKRLCACYERDATMASLFDGIGGFPCIWEQLNGKGTCLWASEIEDFPVAVTKRRLGG
jgi:DNA (cytosine-5)-methyltransferase 1